MWFGFYFNHKLWYDFVAFRCLNRLFNFSSWYSKVQQQLTNTLWVCTFCNAELVCVWQKCGPCLIVRTSPRDCTLHWSLSLRTGFTPAGITFPSPCWLLMWLLLLRSHLTREGFGHIEKGYRCGEFGHLVEVERVFGLEVDLLQRWRHLPSFRGSGYDGFLS